MLPHWRAGSDGGSRTLALAAAATAGVLVAWRLWPRREWPNERCSPRTDIYCAEKVSSARLRPGYRSFPPPYPNGWVFLCPSKAVPRKKVLPLSVCGRHLVAYRTESGEVGVLDAFCSHLGTHLGYGGMVKGENIVCPYHEWEFDATGQLRCIPYAPDQGKADCTRARNNMRSFPVLERHGMVFAWIHADQGEPWDFEQVLNQIDDKGLRPVCRLIDDDYLMHPMEPAHNSCDWYHFRTVHSTLAQHWLAPVRWAALEQTISPARTAIDGSIDDDGKKITEKEILVVDEEVLGMSLLNGLIRLPGSLMKSLVKSQVRFSGPLLAVFHIQVFFFGSVLVFMPMTPTGLFVTHLEYWSFASRSFPWLLAYQLTKWIRGTVNQDREVWEHRTNPMPRNMVKGDYNYNRFDQWMRTFYSESSIKWDDQDFSW